MRRLAGPRTAVALAVPVVVTGMAVSVGAGAGLANNQRNAARDQLAGRVTLVEAAASTVTGRYVDAITMVAAALGGYEPLTATSFAQAASPLSGMGLAGATSIGYLVPAGDDEVAATQELWRSRGATNLTLHPSGTGHEHVFPVFTRVLDGHTVAPNGIDATQAGVPTAALLRARTSGRPAVSDPYHLLIDQQVPAAKRQLAVTLAAPVYGPPDTLGRRPFRGWVSMGLRGQDFMGGTLARVSQNLVDVTLRSPAAGGAPVTVASLHASVPGKRDLTRTVDVPMADRFWQLQVRAHADHLPGAGATAPALVAGSGGLLALLLGGLIYVLATGRARAEARVRTGTANLAAAEAMARRQASLLQAVMESISDGVFVVDEHGEFLLQNPAVDTIFGDHSRDTGPKTWRTRYRLFETDGVTPIPPHEFTLNRALAGEATERVEMVVRNASHPDGIVLAVASRPFTASTGQAGAVAVLHDITARKKADAERATAAQALGDELAHRRRVEAELRAAHDELDAQQAYLTQILDSINVSVLTCDADGTMVHINRAARTGGNLSSLPATVAEHAEAVQLTIGDGTPSGGARHPLTLALAGQEVRAVEMSGTAGGVRRNLLIDAQPLCDTAGRRIGAVASLYDITSLREQEADLRAFAAVAAHDLKAPLAAVAGFAEILDDDLATGTTDLAAMHEPVARIRAGVDRMRRLIDDLLTYATARDADLRLVTVDLRAVVDETIAGQLEHSAADPDRPVPDVYVGAIPPVRADPMLLRQLLHNLIGNAVKYTPPGQVPRVDVTAHTRDDRVHLTVADRGIGIPEGQHAAIFDSFHRGHRDTKFPGTGLGLAICQRIVTRHGGTITATDNPGGGARFHLTLPAAPSAPYPGQHPDAPAGSSARGSSARR